MATDVDGIEAPFPVLDVEDNALPRRLADLVEAKLFA